MFLQVPSHTTSGWAARGCRISEEGGGIALEGRNDLVPQIKQAQGSCWARLGRLSGSFGSCGAGWDQLRTNADSTRFMAGFYGTIWHGKW